MEGLPVLTGLTGLVAPAPLVVLGPPVLTRVAVAAGCTVLPAEAAFTPENWVSWLGVTPPDPTSPDAAEAPVLGLSADPPVGWEAPDGFDNAEVMPGEFLSAGLVPRPTAMSSAAATPLTTPAARTRRRCVVVS